MVSPQERMAEARRRIFRIERLASIPQVVFQLIDALGDAASDASDLERIIESDQGLASKVLSLANSAFYGFSQQITTVRRAVVAIGFKELRLLALGAGLADLFDPRRVPDRFDGQALWVHCLGVSWIARQLAEAARYPEPGEIQVAGLLHDLGKLVLFTHLEEEAETILDLAAQGVPFHEAERRLGLPHTVIGGMLAAKWGLPEVLISAIRYHHRPLANDPYYSAACLVAVADRLTKALGFGLATSHENMDGAAVMDGACLDDVKLKQVAGQARERLPSVIDGWRQMILKGDSGENQRQGLGKIKE